MHRRPAALPLLAVLSLAGCLGIPGHMEGGNRRSIDRHTYVSRPLEPKTINLIDTRSGEILWTYEVPVGRKLSIQFYKNRNEDPNFPDEMRWDEMGESENFASLSNAMPVPPSSARKISWDIRPIPEYAHNPGS